MKRVVGVVAVAGLVAAGCGGGSDGPKVAERAVHESTTTTTKPARSGSAITETYFKAIAASEPTVIERDAIANSVPGSVAAKYASAQFALSKAVIDNGQQQTMNPPGSYSVDGDKVFTCEPGKTPSSPPGADGIKPCTVFTAFVVDKKTKKLSSFLANGTDLAPRLAGGGAPVAVAGGTVTLVAAYRAVQSGNLFVVLNVAAGNGTLNAYAYSASYITPSSQQLQVSGSISAGPSNGVQPGANANYILGFPGADIGGRVVIQVADAGFNTTDVTIPIV